METTRLVGKTLEDAAGEPIGEVTDVVPDASGTRVDWVCVRTGLRRREHLVPRSAVQVRAGHVQTRLSRDVIRHAPVAHTHTPPLAAEAAELHAYYERYGEDAAQFGG